MTTTIRLIGVFCMVLCLALALPSEDLFAQKGKKPGGKEKTEFVAQLTLDDRPGAHVLSDGKQRTGDDNDADGFLDLVKPETPLLDVIYQDHRISYDLSGVHPDPCSGFGISEGGPQAGRVFADLDRGDGDAFSNCALFEDPDFTPIFPDTETRQFLNDARTITLVFDKTDSTCACDQFSNLTTTGNTQFINKDGSESCSLTLAEGPIFTGTNPPATSNPRIIAYPFKEVKGKKGAAPKPATSTGIHINFRVDDTGEPNGWGVWSEEDDITVELYGADGRDVTSTNQTFKLIQFGAGGIDNPACSGFTMPFHMTFIRFEVPVQ